LSILLLGLELLFMCRALDRHGEGTKTAIAERQKFSAFLKMLRAGLM
jgi:hypothetical protein